MDESRTYSITGRFDPPEEGLLAGESIVWTRRAGTGFWLIFFGFIIVIGGPAVLFGVIQELSSPLAFLFAILVAAGIIGEVALFIQTKRTRYYLTSERILEVRGANIIKEISLHHFAGKPIGQFLESRVTHRSNNRPIYTIRIYDPMSDEVFEIKGQDYNSTMAFERIGDVRECPYCNYDNTALSTLCRNCGAVL
ncbi:MAG: hypothetical protein EAX87_07875 [Candidatus Thorarchaeota archaeon]|nr:hypothetical protein [Candidatus Thorarchaeota archaeon]